MTDERWQTELAEASDDLLEEALELAHVPALMAALTHLLGSTEHLQGDIRPNVVPLAEEEDGLSEQQRQEARRLAPH